MSETSRLLLLVSLVAATAAAHGADELARCAAIAAPDTRLACYDTLAHRPADPAPSSAINRPNSPAAAAQGVAATASAPGNIAASPGGAPAISTANGAAAAAPSSTSAASSAAAFYADPRNFGLDPVQKEAVAAGPKSMSARIENLGSDQAGRTSIVLDSGERWTVFDNDGRLSAGDEVTIKRASLGSYLMMTRSNHSYRVRRIQ
jgi:hypothetical protein